MPGPVPGICVFAAGRKRRRVDEGGRAPCPRDASSVQMTMQSSTRPTGSRERTLDEVKAEVLRRAGRFSPFESIRPQDAATVMNALASLDRDHWAEQWCKIGLAYEAEGDARAKAGADRK